MKTHFDLAPLSLSLPLLCSVKVRNHLDYLIRTLNEEVFFPYQFIFSASSELDMELE